MERLEMKKFRIGVIGCGAIAQGCHIPGYMAADNCILAAVADPEDRCLKMLRDQKMIFEHEYHDYREMLVKEKLDMVLGEQISESTQYGRNDFTVTPIEGADLTEQLHEAVQHIGGEYRQAELPDLGDEETIQESIPADPNVKNYSYTIVDGEVYFRENSVMVKPVLNATAKERVKGMVELRDCVHRGSRDTAHRSAYPETGGER